MQTSHTLPDPAAGATSTDLGRIACLFSTSGHSGIDRIARNLIPALAGRGYRVDQLKVKDHGPTLASIPDGVRVIDLGARHTYAGLPAILRYLRHHRPGVLLSDKDRVNRLALLARALAGVTTRVVVRSGTTISRDLASRSPLDRWIQRRSMGWLYRLADQVLVPCAAVAADMASYTGLPAARIQAVPSPIVPARLLAERPPPPDHPWLAAGEPPLILGVGELCGRKDFATLLRAFARVRAQRPCRLLILGRGAARRRLLEEAQALGVGADVALPGFVPEPYGYMAHASLLALTSRWEGLPVAPVEALALGTPVVATDCPSGPAEILQQGRYGALVPVGDAAALAAAILTTLQNPLPADRLREAARPYEIEAATDAYLAAMGLPARPAG